MSQSKSILSPSFNRLASPNPDKIKNSNSKFNSGNKTYGQESTIARDRITSPSQTVLSFTKLTDPFSKFGEQSTVKTADVNFVKKNNNNLYEGKSPDNFNLNPNFFQKRKHTELLAPKELKFEKEIKSSLDQKKPMNLESFIIKNNFK